MLKIKNEIPEGISCWLKYKNSDEVVAESQEKRGKEDIVNK